MVIPGVNSFTGEPEADLVVGGFNGVRSVDDVTANIDAEVTSDGSGKGVLGSGGTEHNSSSGDGTGSFPDHSDNGSGAHVVNERREETPGLKIGVMLFHVVSSGRALLHGDELEALLFEAGDDLTDNSALDGIGLEHDEGAFSVFDHLDVILSLIMLNTTKIINQSKSDV